MQIEIRQIRRRNTKNVIQGILHYDKRKRQVESGKAIIKSVNQFDAIGMI